MHFRSRQGILRDCRGDRAALNAKISQHSFAMTISRQRIFAVVFALFSLEYSIYLIDGIAMDAVIKLGCLAVAVCLLRSAHLPGTYRITLFYYGLLFISALVGSLSHADFVGVLQEIKIVLPFAFLPIMLSLFRGGRDTPDFLIRSHFPWALLFVVQSLVLFFVIYCNFDYPAHYVDLQRLENMPELSYGILGYANAIGSSARGDRMLRAQAWFLEPSNLAGYLMYPLFVSFGYFLSTRKWRFLVLSLVFCGGFLITFSAAGVIAFMGAIIFLLFFRRGRQQWSSWTHVKILGAIALLVLAARFYMGYAGAAYVDRDKNALTTVLARDEDNQRVIRSASRVSDTLVLLQTRPLGIGFGSTLGSYGNNTTSPNAAVYWIVAGGIPALLVLILLYRDLFFNYCMPLLRSSFPLHRMIAAAFIGVSIQELSYGRWISPFYLFVVGVMMLAAHADRERAFTKTLANVDCRK